jgi:hypothetical protein
MPQGGDGMKPHGRRGTLDRVGYAENLSEAGFSLLGGLKFQQGGLAVIQKKRGFLHKGLPQFLLKLRFRLGTDIGVHAAPFRRTVLCMAIMRATASSPKESSTPADFSLAMRAS